MTRRLILAISVAGTLILTAFQPLAPPEPPNSVTPRAWQATASEAADVIVTAQGFPDLSPARDLRTKEAKTRFVVDTLIAHADTAQAPLRADLAARGLRFLPLWITNQVLVRDVRRADLLWLANRADVARIDLDEPIKGVESMPPITQPTSRIANPSAIEWGVVRVNAPAAWALGYTGQGVVIANLDTGVLWQHDALRPKYRGWDGSAASHDYNWFDPTAFAPAPVDVNGHGTHTIGTSVGDDGAGNQVGVAPGARWIACRNMAGPQGVGSVALYTACFQFALAPSDVAGNAPNPALGADITSNSWGCDPSYGEAGCEVPTALVTATQVLRDAGVMVIASAGNNGSGCRSVNNAPGTLDQAFSIGATDSSNAIASFSSRGPSALTGRLKPDLVAPGVAVRSAIFNSPTSYGLKSGTSMAAPHVAGAAALVWSAAPWLRGDVDMTEALLRATARPQIGGATCGGVPGSAVPNNTFGHGLVDAEAALRGAFIIPSTTAPLTATLGQPLTFTIAVTNAAAWTYAGVVITSAVPASAVVIDASPPATVANGAIAWSIGDLSPAQTVQVTYVISPSWLGSNTNSPLVLSYAGARPIPGRPAMVVVEGERIFAPLLAQ